MTDGLAAGTTADIALFPAIDTLKTQLQSPPPSIESNVQCGDK